MKEIKDVLYEMPGPAAAWRARAVHRIDEVPEGGLNNGLLLGGEVRQDRSHLLALHAQSLFDQRQAFRQEPDFPGPPVADILDAFNQALLRQALHQLAGGSFAHLHQNPNL